VIERLFIDWSTPCLRETARVLLDRAASDRAGAMIDLSAWRCVVPGRRAGRLLLGEFIDESRVRGSAVIPPSVITPGDLARALLDFNGPVADSMAMTFAWMRALRTMSNVAMRPLVSRPPAPGDVGGWWSLATALARVHDELGAGDVPFERVADSLERAELALEGERWRVVAATHQRVEAILRDAGLLDPNRAVIDAIDRGAWIDERPLALVGTIDLNPIQARIIAARPAPVVSFIPAPESLADRFDEIGCVRDDAWRDAAIDVPRHEIVQADTLADAAQAALDVLASFDGRCAAEDVIFGLGDPRAGEAIARAAGRAGLRVHLAAGTSVRRTTPILLLEAAAAWLDEPRFANFAALVRHTDLERHLRRALPGEHGGIAASEWLVAMDEYFADHLQARMDGTWLGAENRAARLRAVHHAVDALLAPLRGDARPPAEWMPALLDVLRAVYGEIAAGTQVVSEQRAAAACAAVHRAAESIVAVPGAVQAPVSAAAAIGIVIEAAGADAVPEPPRENSIEALGWLELHLDPSPAAIIVPVNDGAIPESIAADAFLNDSLRTRLGLPGNARRYARDACVMSALRASRRHISFITARRDADGEPLPPSRLLLSVPIDELPGRVALLTDAARAAAYSLPRGAPRCARVSRFVIPPAPAQATLERISVTAFRAYLECPYRFWLGRLLHLDAAQDSADELDPLEFGTLAHDALARLVVDDPAARSTNPADVARFLRGGLDAIARERFGRAPLPAVRVQLARLHERLEAAAHVQARLRRDGWEIAHSELPLRDDVVIEIPDQPAVRLTGKIDRIDRRGESFLLIDYKSSEKPDTPRTAHGPRKDGSWRDLQLPLYHYAWTTFGGHKSASPESVKTAYFALPKSARDVALLESDWSADDLAGAIEAARDVVRRIRAAAFPIQGAGGRDDPFAAICQSTAFGGGAAEDEEEEGDA
jgi:ATP-dependent helicase/nuclease subunit B